MTADRDTRRRRVISKQRLHDIRGLVDEVIEVVMLGNLTDDATLDRFDALRMQLVQAVPELLDEIDRLQAGSCETEPPMRVLKMDGRSGIA